MEFRFKFILIFIYFYLTSIQFNESAKILAIFPFPGPSQYILVKPYLKTLASRGHELTVINAFPSKENEANYRDVPVMEVHKIQEGYIEESQQERNSWSELNLLSDLFTNVTRAVLENSLVQEILKTETFDLTIIEAVNLDALYGLGKHFGVPIIGVSSFGSDFVINEMMGNPTNLAYIPSMLTGFTQSMSYGERLQNLIAQLENLLHCHLVHQPRHQELLQRFMPHITEDITTLRQNISLYLLNYHFSLGFPKPYMPNMIEVGGFQIPKTAKPLPAAIRRIIDESSQDIIYFSMGSNVKSKDFPLHMLQMFNEVFSQLPYTILWKFENAKLPGKPSNVHINPWFPQVDILAEPKVKLFISHGGLLSCFEAAHHGKPILGIPVFFDQNLNVNNAKKGGYALKLDISSLTKSQFKETILEMMRNPSYAEKAKELSRKYHDKPNDPMDLAIFWTEYILRHRGAEFLRSPAQKMNFLQRHSLDTVGVLVVAILALFGIVIWIVLKLGKLVFSLKSRKEKIN